MLASLLAGIGGAASAGLNAYLPLLIVALADRVSDRIDLNSPYNFISEPWAIIVLLALLPIELIADKIPRLDHASDLLHSAIRPAAAAFLMMALTDERGHVNAVVALLFGLVIGVVVHGYKATTRPAITVATSGLGNPIISMLEDVIVVIVVLFAVFFPLAIIAVLPLCGYALYRAYSRLKQGTSLLRRLSGSPS